MPDVRHGNERNGPIISRLMRAENGVCLAYLTVVSTGLLLSFEIYEVIEQVSMLRIGVLLLNLIIVFYLVRQLKRHTLRARTHLPRHEAIA